MPPSRWIQLPSASACLTKLDTPILSTTYTVTLNYSGNYAGNSQTNEVITVSPTQSYTVSGWTKTKGGAKDYDDNEGITLNSSFTLYPYIKKAHNSFRTSSGNDSISVFANDFITKVVEFALLFFENNLFVR